MSTATYRNAAESSPALIAEGASTAAALQAATAIRVIPHNPRAIDMDSARTPAAARNRLHGRAINLARRIVHYFAPTPKQRLIISAFAIGMAWGVMCAIGMMAAWGIHP